MKEQQHGALLLHQIFLRYINLRSLKAEPLTAVRLQTCPHRKLLAAS